METLVMYLLLAVVGAIAIVGVLMNLGLEKKLDGVSRNIRNFTQLNQEERPRSKKNAINDETLNNVLEGLEFYRNESEKWHKESIFWKSAYDKERENLDNLELRFREVEREVSNLKYIVNKMDGREIVRDENQNITGIRRVK